MKKLLLLSILSATIFAGDLLLGFGYGSVQAKVDNGTTEYTTENIRDTNYKLGWEFKNHSRILVTQNNPMMKDGEELTLQTFSWQAIDQTDPYIKGFFGIAVGQFSYKNENLSIEEYKATPYGVELGIMLLEDGDWLKHMELEFGYRYFVGMSEVEGFKIKSLSNSYVGFNFLF